MTATSDRTALLRSILVDVEDDNPRLQFADWLEELGECERAEFIRVQCELAAWPIEKCDSIYPGCAVSGGAVMWHDHKCPMYPVANRSRELLMANFGFWIDGLPESLVMGQCPNCVDRGPDWETGVVECGHCDCTGLVPCYDHVEFTRGFVSSIALSTADFLRHAAAIFSSQPCVQVRLIGREPRPASIRASGGLGRGWVHWSRIPDGDEIHPLYDGEEHWLPAQIYDLLDAGEDRADWKRFDTPQLAHAALSLAACNWARSLAGLPELTRKDGR